jgi:large subunit ribosomal protein L18
MINKIDKNEIRKRKHLRVRKSVSGTTERPRLCVYRSNSHIYAQVIDDTTGTTLAAASSLDKDAKLDNGSNIEAAKEVGKLIAQRAQDKKISEVVFDRGGYVYHGRVAALAEAAREAGLQFYREERIKWLILLTKNYRRRSSTSAVFPRLLRADVT